VPLGLISVTNREKAVVATLSERRHPSLWSPHAEDGQARRHATRCRCTTRVQRIGRGRAGGVEPDCEERSFEIIVDCPCRGLKRAPRRTECGQRHKQRRDRLHPLSTRWDLHLMKSADQIAFSRGQIWFLTFDAQKNCFAHYGKEKCCG
jgi:hypothetical protein